MEKLGYGTGTTRLKLTVSARNIPDLFRDPGDHSDRPAQGNLRSTVPWIPVENRPIGFPKVGAQGLPDRPEQYRQRVSTIQTSSFYENYCLRL